MQVIIFELGLQLRSNSGGGGFTHSDIGEKEEIVFYFICSRVATQVTSLTLL